MEVEILVYATNSYAARSYKSLKINITNTYDASKRETVLAEFHAYKTNGTISTHPYYPLSVSNMMNMYFPEPRLPMYGGIVCLTDYHCFDHGICDFQSGGKAICICSPGYTGLQCSVTITEYFMG